ncbi:MAG: DUF4364 family protein [Clostridia bacterium]|nr:DUF4364 family protein [Clostridia bacterium]
MSGLIGNVRNVKIFVLYLMENINYPMDFVTINDIVMQTDYVMYLDLAEAFAELTDGELIEKITEEGEDRYRITDKGRHVARELKSDILPGILDRALEAALRYLNFKERGIVPRCTVERVEGDRFAVTCSFTEQKVCIFSQTLIVDTETRALQMQSNFYERPEAVYRGVHALLSGNVNYLFD